MEYHTWFPFGIHTMVKNFGLEQIRELPRSVTYAPINGSHTSIDEGVRAPESRLENYNRPVLMWNVVKGLLEQQGVLVVHGSGFGSKYGAGHFRLVYLPPIATLESAMNKIESFCASRQ